MCGLGNSSSKEREFFKDVMDAKMFRLDEVAEGVMVGSRDDYGTIIFINVNVGEGAKIISCLARVITARKIVFFSKGREEVRTNFLARVTVVRKFLSFEC